MNYINAKFESIGFECLLKINEKIVPRFVLEFYSQLEFNYNSEGHFVVHFVIQNKSFSFTLEEFGHILGIPSKGHCSYSDKWSLDYLEISTPTKGRYQTTPPSPSVIKTLIQTPRQGQITRVRNKKTINVDDNEILNREIQHHSAFARFNTIITSLKALDEGYYSRNYVRKFLRALHPKWRAKVMTIEESKDLTSLSLDELIGNLKVHEMIIKKDSEIVKAKVEWKYLALKAKKESSDEECSTSGSEDEEYVMAVRHFKKFFKRRDPNHLIGECLKPPRDKNQRSFVGGSWSDSGEENDEKIQDETCLVAQAPNEVCSESSYFSDENSSIDDLALDNEYDKLCKMSLKIITKNKRLKAIRNSLENELRELKDKFSTLEKNKGVDIDCAKCHTLKIENEKLKEESTRLNKFEKSTHCLNEMLNNQKPFGDKLGLGFNSFEASSSGTKEINLLMEICLGVDLEPDEWIKDSGCSKHMMANRKLFSIYKAYIGGKVIFGSNLRGNIIGKGQICDNKCKVTFFEHDSKITKDGKVIVSIRTDHGREFDNEVQFGEFCNANGITHNFSAPRTPQSNGVVERKNRTLQEMSRTMLNEQSLPQKFWCNAVDTSTYILNRILIRAILGKTPYELLREPKNVNEALGDMKVG
ncbi:zf-CCHC domain-containing protein [Tanacetum coccineum]